MSDRASAWTDAIAALCALCVDPAGLGGVVLRAAPGPVRDRWLALLRERLPADAPMRRVPLHVADDRLLGGLDLAATLAQRRPVAQRGLLAEADGGVVVLAMAERVSAADAARVTAALDTGLVLQAPARFAAVALDEGLDDEQRAPPALRERLAFAVDLTAVALREIDDVAAVPPAIERARQRLPRVSAPADAIAALCDVAQRLGVDTLRAPLFALRAARALAALAGRDEISDDDLASAARLVLAPRALRVPAPAPSEPEPPTPDERADDDEVRRSEALDRPLEDRVLDAAQAAIPPDVLALLHDRERTRGRAKVAGRAGQAQDNATRGRPTGARPGRPRGGARLDVLATLRTAAPWQPLRRREHAQADGGAAQRVLVLAEDFRVVRYRQRTRTTTIFAVDASGSAALHRLAETKGAVELLLAECYVRRDQVALVAFRGRGAELLLPPTRSLVRAKRSLAALPGGGGTPLAAGIVAACDLARAASRRGETAIVVVLTDGRANVARDGNGGRAQAFAEALHAARAAAADAIASVLVDTSPHPAKEAREVADAMGARYVALPHAGAAQIAAAVQAKPAPRR
ncbi:MAG: magnesium chelatase subunit D [Burkholderiales bacterium]